MEGSSSVLAPFHPYMICQVIKAHDKCVRCLCVLEDSRFVTGGLDGVVAIWCKFLIEEEAKNNSSSSSSTSSSAVENNKYNYRLQRTFEHHAGQFVYSVCASKIKAKSSHLCFYSGGKDSNVYRINADTGDIDVAYAGLHEGAICSIKEIAEKETLLTGSWDGKVGVWNVLTADVLAVLKGHSYAVCVDALPDGRIISASQDKVIRFWKNFEESKTLPESHDDIIRKFAVLDEVFLSASNDETIKCWDFDGNLLSTLNGHCSFVFDVIGSRKRKGIVASASEDKTLRIWSLENSSCEQQILHPAALWQVAELDTGDIITACEDSIVRIWTTDENRALPLKERERIEKETMIAIEDANKGGSDESIANLPDVSQMHKIQGASKGDIRLFSEGGKPNAFEWNGNEWNKIGSVTGLKRPKKFYEGDQLFEAGEYDYVFDVEIGDNGVYKKLPFNAGDNPLVTAEKFCSRENISKASIEQIVDFINKNALTLKGGVHTAGQGRGGPAYDSTSSSFKDTDDMIAQNKGHKKSQYFPLMETVAFERANWSALEKKILAFSDEMPPDAQERLTDPEKMYLKESIAKLKKPNWITQEFRACELDVIFKKLSTWNSSIAFPVMDLWRGLALHTASTNLHKGTDDGWRYINIALKHIQQSEGENSNDSYLLVLCSLRYINNLLHLSTNRGAVLRRRTQILEGISRVADNLAGKTLTRLAYVTILTNFAIAFGDKKETEGRTQVMRKLAEVLEKASENEEEQDEETVNRILVAIGTLMCFDQNCCSLFKDLNVTQMLDKIKNKSQKTTQIITDIHALTV